MDATYFSKYEILPSFSPMSSPLKKFSFALNFVYLCMRVCIYECRCPQKPMALDLLEPELQMVVKCPTWV